MDNKYDLIVVGAGASGIISAIISARDGKKVLILEKLSQIASKLKATGGGRCNLTNTLSNSDFMNSFGKNGRFMQDALKEFDYKNLQLFFKEIGVETHAPDGFRIFPTSHSSVTIIKALQNEMDRLNIEILLSQKVIKILQEENSVTGVQTQNTIYKTSNIILASGGLGYPTLGAEGDGYLISKELGHSVSELHPAMMPLNTKESWVNECRADTISKVELKVDIKKHKKLHANGDLIFTKKGIRGPVVLDFAREITPLLSKYDEVPLLLNLTKGMNEDEILKHFKNEINKNQNINIIQLVKTILVESLSIQICKLADVDKDSKLNKIDGSSRAKLINLLAWTPLTIIGHDGFKMAMITRGGINLKEIDPKTMQSKIIKGLYFCGEIMNLDGPCGGYNLQWSFSSGYLAGLLNKNNG